jgi:hypothetical protein
VSQISHQPIFVQYANLKLCHDFEALESVINELQGLSIPAEPFDIPVEIRRANPERQWIEPTTWLEIMWRLILGFRKTGKEFVGRMRAETKLRCNGTVVNWEGALAFEALWAYRNGFCLDPETGGGRCFVPKSFIGLELFSEKGPRNMTCIECRQRYFAAVVGQIAQGKEFGDIPEFDAFMKRLNSLFNLNLTIADNPGGGRFKQVICRDLIWKNPLNQKLIWYDEQFDDRVKFMFIDFLESIILSDLLKYLDTKVKTPKAEQRARLIQCPFA